MQEDVGREAVFTLQQMDLFQRDGHRRPIFSALAAREPRAVHRPTDLHRPTTHRVLKKQTD